MNPKLLAPRTIKLETPNYIVRTLEAADATDGWREWMTDPTALRHLNAKPRVLTDAEIHAYIARFDRMNAHLLGIFEKDTGDLVGIRTFYIDPKRNEFLVNVLVGESEARNKGARTETRNATFRFFFEELGMQAGNCTVLATNEPMMRLMAPNGWIHEGTTRNPAADGRSTIEVHRFRLPREIWKRKEIERTQAGTT